MIPLLFAGNNGNLNKFCKFQLGEKVTEILKNYSYLISNSPYTIKLASKLKLRFCTLPNGMV